MKHFVFLLLPLIFLICIVSGQDPPLPPVLESRWDIFTPVLFFCSENANFIFRFGMSDLVEDSHIDFTLKRGNDCEIDIWNNNYLVPTTIWDQAPLGEGNLVRQVLVSLEPDINLLAVSPIYSVSEDGATGSINFCVKVTLWTKDRANIVNFKEVKYTQNTVMKADVRKLEFEMDNSIFEQNSHQSHRRLAYDCTDGYEGVFENWWNITVLENGEILPPNVTVMTPVDPYEVTYDNVDVAPGNETGPQEPDEGLVKIVIAPENALNLNDVDGLGGGEVGFELFFLLIAYACDENNLPVTTVPPLTQGDTIKICVEPDEKSREYGFVMKQLDSTYYTRDDIPDLIQYAVEGGQPDFWGMSEIDCIPGSLKCSVETTIRAEFFASPGIVSVAGAASFQWDFERRRNLNETVGRDLQAVDGRDVNDEGRFNIVFPLTTFQETMDMKAKGPSSLQSFLLIILSFTLILASIILLWIKDTRRSWTYHNDDDDGCTIRQSMSSHVTPGSSHLKKDMAETYRTESFHDDVRGHLKKDMAETHGTESFHYDFHGHLKKDTEETCRTESIHHDVYDDDIDADYCLKLKC